MISLTSVYLQFGGVHAVAFRQVQNGRPHLLEEGLQGFKHVTANYVELECLDWLHFLEVLIVGDVIRCEPS